MFINLQEEERGTLIYRIFLYRAFESRKRTQRSAFHRSQNKMACVSLLGIRPVTDKKRNNFIGAGPNDDGAVTTKSSIYQIVTGLSIPLSAPSLISNLPVDLTVNRHPRPE